MMTSNVLASLLGAVTGTLGLLGLSGWALGMPLLASFRPSYIPMAPSSAIALFFLGGALVACSLRPPGRFAGATASALSVLVSAYGLATLLRYFGIPTPSLGEWLLPDPPRMGGIVTGRMSPSTAAVLLLAGPVVPLLLSRAGGGGRRKVLLDLAGCLATIVAVVGTVFVLGYLHGTPFLYGSRTIPMAATTALAVLSLGTGQMLAVGRDGFPLRLISGPSARARLLRVFVSTMIVAMLVSDLLHVYLPWVFFEDDALLAGISTTLFAMIAGGLIARFAWKLGGEMDRSEGVRNVAMEKLRESEDRYRDLVEHSRDLICTHDLQGRILSVNPWAAKVLGYDPEDLLGRNFRELLSPKYLAGFDAYLDEMRKHGSSQGLMAVRTRSGERRIWEYRNTLRTEGVAEPIVRGMARDITERKRAEAEREKLQAQLVQAMKMEAVGRLAGGVAHDFNNILTAIIGNVSMANLRIHPSDPASGMLAEANKAAERAALLTQQLLAFSRKQIIEPRVLNLNDLIADLKAMLARLIREDIELQVRRGKDLWATKVDASQFQQVLVNLVVNARDAMPDGGRIVIETSNAELDDAYCAGRPYVKPGRFVMVAVSDTGHGMSEEVKAHIFEPFFTTKPMGSGTGLGLATAYGAVKQSGGSIEVETEVGAGTTFRIFLPRVEEEASKPGREDAPRKLPGGAETVLLVEDEGIVRRMCARALDELGYKVLQASSGEEAIAVSDGYGGRIDLLMTDVVMPGMNGGELAKRLNLDRPGMKVLFTSGYTEDVIVHHGVLNGEVSFLGKPYSPSLLAKKVREVLDKSR